MKLRARTLQRESSEVFMKASQLCTPKHCQLPAATILLSIAWLLWTFESNIFCLWCYEENISSIRNTWFLNSLFTGMAQQGSTWWGWRAEIMMGVGVLFWETLSEEHLEMERKLIRFEKLKSVTLRRDRVEVEGDMGSDRKILICAFIFFYIVISLYIICSNLLPICSFFWRFQLFVTFKYLGSKCLIQRFHSKLSCLSSSFNLTCHGTMIQT